MDEVRRTITIPLEHVLERDGFNVRPDIADIEELAASIKDLGVLHPPLVVRATDRDPISETEFYYHVIHGHRRIRAMRSLGWVVGQFSVASPTMSLVEQFILNLAENIRQDISKAQIADRCYQIIESSKRDGRTVTPEDLAPSIGYSVSYVRQFVQLRRDLHPDVWGAMVRLRNRAPIRKLLKVCRLPQHAQPDVWNQIERTLAQIGSEEGGDERGGNNVPPKKPPRIKKASWRSTAVELVKAAPPDCVRGARWLLEELGARLGRADIERALSDPE